MKTLTLWTDSPAKTENADCFIYDICYSPIGDTVAVSVGHSIHIYDVVKGTLVKSIKETNGGTIHCVAYSSDGKNIAAGTSLKSVVVWTSEGAGLIKYSHGDSIQCLAYDPTPTSTLVSCAINDFGFYRPNKQKVDKTKVNSKINVCAWSKDGVHLALGLSNGVVTIRTQKGDEFGRIERPGGCQIWGLSWVPSQAEPDKDMICVADWGQSLSFYNTMGKQVVKERSLDFDPIKLVYVTSHRDCKYLIVAGSNRACAVFTLDGIRIALLAEQASWIWSLAVRPNLATGACHMVVGTVGGVVTCYELQILIVHALFKSLYAYRVNMTDVKIQNLDDDIYICMKCRDLVKKIAISRRALAVQLSEKVLIYQREERTDDFKYRLTDLITQKFECSLLVLCNENLIVCQDNQLQSYTFTGVKVREWVLESNIRYIRSVGGMPPNEVLLAGLKDGQVVKIFLTNPTPMNLLKVPQSVRCLDQSLSHTKLAVIDDTLTLYVYDLKTQQLLFQEPNAITVFWNTAIDDLISFSGVGELRVKANGFKLFSQNMAIHKDAKKPTKDRPEEALNGDDRVKIGSAGDSWPTTTYTAFSSDDSDEESLSNQWNKVKSIENQDEFIVQDYCPKKFNGEELNFDEELIKECENYDLNDPKFLSKGFVVGFNGNKVFSMHNSAVHTLDISLKTPVRQYTDQKMFNEAYSIACLGVGDVDMTYLGTACVKGENYDIAKKVFSKLNRIDIVKLIKTNELKVKRGQMKPGSLLAEVYALQGHLQEAAKCFKENGEEHRAVAMYADLRQFDLAQEYMGTGNSRDKVELMRMKADWAVKINEFRAAADMYLAAGEKLKAIEIMANNGWRDMLLEMGQKLEPNEKNIMSACADALVKLGQVAAAAAMYTRVGAVEKVLKIYVETRDWSECFAIAKKHPELKKDAYLPYAQWLAESDRFAEAQKAFHEAGFPEEAFKVLEVLIRNAVSETRFQDASYYHWILATQYLDMAKVGADDDEKAAALDQFMLHSKKAVMYFCFNAVYKYIESPFTPYASEVLFSMAKYLMHEFLSTADLPVSKFHVLYTLVKQARTVKAFKFARQVMEKLCQVKVPSSLERTVDMLIIQAKADPFEDNISLQAHCYRCSTTNPFINPRGNDCINCFHPFVFSFPQFEILPLVEFQLEEGITDEEAISLIGSRLKPGNPKQNGKSAINRYRNRRGSHIPNKRWRETTEDEDLQILHLDDGDDMDEDNEESLYEGDDDDPFYSKSTDTYDERIGYVPIIIGRDILRTLEPSKVLIRKWPAPLRYNFYKHCLPETVPLVSCQTCWMLFYADDFHVYMLWTGNCPFCRSPLQPNNKKSTAE